MTTRQQMYSLLEFLSWTNYLTLKISKITGGCKHGMVINKVEVVYVGFILDMKETQRS